MRIFGVWMFVVLCGAADFGVVHAKDDGALGLGYSRSRHPCRAAEPYYDHGPNWGEDPKTTHPVYAIDPSCNR